MSRLAISTRVADSIVRAVSDEMGLAYAEIISDCRRAELVRARRRVYQTLRDMGASYPQIGRLMQRDHTTIVHALRAA